MVKAKKIDTRPVEIRVARGFTQAEAARLMGIGTPTLAKVENKTNDISPNMRNRISNAYAVEVSELFVPVGRPVPPPLVPLRPPPPPPGRAAKKTRQVSGGEPPGRGKLIEDPKTFKLLQIWEDIPEHKHDLALAILESIRDEGRVRSR